MRGSLERSCSSGERERRLGSPEGGHREPNGEGYGDKQEGANEDPQAYPEASPPAQSAVGAGTTALFVFQLSQFGGRARHWRYGTPYTIRARSRELAKSTPMTMATSTRSTAEAAG